MLLEVKDLTVHYGKSLAIEGISLEVAQGGVVSIIGANGSGKSTLLRALVGLAPVTAGRIYFSGSEITRRSTMDIIRSGIAYVPEGRQLFPYMSVLTNLKLGASFRKDRENIKADLEFVYQLFPRLAERKSQHAGTLSGGEQQMLAIGRGLMTRPRLLCMDEPSLGLAPIVIEQLGNVIENINKNGVTVLLVEQNIHLALGVAKTGYALQVGKVVLEGDIETIKQSEIVRKAYLGG